MEKFARILILPLLVICAGCSTVQIPNYIPAPDNPLVRKFYSPYDQVVQTVKMVLAKQGYAIESSNDPSLYERSAFADQPGFHQVLLFTPIHQSSRIIYTRYTHLNVFIRSVSDGAEVEIRSSSTNSVLFKQFRRNRNDKLVKRLLDQIERQLLSSKLP